METVRMVRVEDRFLGIDKPAGLSLATQRAAPRGLAEKRIDKTYLALCIDSDLLKLG